MLQLELDWFIFSLQVGLDFSILYIMVIVHTIIQLFRVGCLKMILENVFFLPWTDSLTNTQALSFWKWLKFLLYFPLQPLLQVISTLSLHSTVFTKKWFPLFNCRPFCLYLCISVPERFLWHLLTPQGMWAPMVRGLNHCEGASIHLGCAKAAPLSVRIWPEKE